MRTCTEKTKRQDNINYTASYLLLIIKSGETMKMKQILNNVKACGTAQSALGWTACEPTYMNTTHDAALRVGLHDRRRLTLSKLTQMAERDPQNRPTKGVGSILGAWRLLILLYFRSQYNKSNAAPFKLKRLTAFICPEITLIN